MVSGFFKKKDSASSLIHTLCRLFVALTVLQPVLDFQMPRIDDLMADWDGDYALAAEQGQFDAVKAQCDVIQHETEAYIYDKADQLDCNIQVSITLSPDAPYAPIQAKMTGTVSPYAKSVLTDVLTNELGIPKEEQHWI